MSACKLTALWRHFGRRASAYGVLFLALALEAGCGDASTKPDTDTSVPLEIAYIRYSAAPTSPDLYRMSADGRVSRNVAALPGAEFLPAWSADGRRFAFIRMEGPAGCGALWEMDADGTGVRQVATSSFLGACDTSWSPDGAQLAFSGVNAAFTPGIGLMNADGTNLRWLPGTADAQMRALAWSPDGRRLAFAVYDANAITSSIRIVDVDGSNPKVLASGWEAADPSWSPDGSQIAFTLQETAYDSLRVAVIDTTGTGKRYVSTGPSDWSPSWSPDGRFIVYVHWLLPDRSHIYKVPVSGGSPVDLTPNDSMALTPIWRRVAGS